jgi:hypothetical protein
MPGFESFVALVADGNELSGKSGSDVLNILYEPPASPDAQFTNFSYEEYPADPGSHPLSLWIRMTFDQLKQLHDALKAEEKRLPSTLDPGEFHLFLHRVSHELASQPSARFADARFGGIARESEGVIVAHFGLGVDIAGTIHDGHGRITVEQHVVPRHPRRFRPLSRADRHSLAAAVAAFLRAAPSTPDAALWRQLETDAQR